ncbi:LysR family transcriptional regulator [Ideonella sp.]|uniref:LysR family transcriptional regulator n=1 Tax=Ideonella sp. TaxID=1929293 RepID=UPI002B4A2967|nr:LysR family transcriptional regulator [Ideonella sp.]HJV69264.1 LysR family transcriptional regulator [Ideonella sp.]
MLHNADPTTLRLFVAVCEEGNIARAAEREAIVPSAISKRIAAMEEEAGVQLIQRGRRGVTLTAAGQALLRQARAVLGGLERLHAELSEFASGVQGSVRVLASISVLSEQLPDDLAGFLARYQSVRVSIEERVSAEIVRQVREGAADFGVLWDAGDMQGLATLPYREDAVGLVVHADNPLARRRGLRLPEALDLEMVGVAPGSIMETMLRRHAARAGRTWSPRIQVSTLDAACRIVAARMGVAILPKQAIEPHMQAFGLHFVPLAEPWARRRFVICLRQHATLTAAARLLVDHLVQRARM